MGTVRGTPGLYMLASWSTIPEMSPDPTKVLWGKTVPHWETLKERNRVSIRRTLGFLSLDSNSSTCTELFFKKREGSNLGDGHPSTYKGSSWSFWASRSYSPSGRHDQSWAPSGTHLQSRLVWIHVTRTFPQGKSSLAKDVSEHLIHLTVISFFYMNELTL